MTDISNTVAPKSDQLNADDLIAGPRTIKITKVAANPSSPEQPIAISFEGDNGKPYLPCKSMRRVLIGLWGTDGNQFVGRSLTLYRDDKVKFGGLEVGGIRISHASDIPSDVTMALTVTRASRKPFVVRPLRTQPPAQKQAQRPPEAAEGGGADGGASTFLLRLALCTTADEVKALKPIIAKMSGEERKEAISLCESKIAAFEAAQAEAPQDEAQI